MMDRQLVDSFVKQSLAAGLPKEKIAMLLDKAQEISTRQQPNTKVASVNKLDRIVTNLLKEAGLEKTASSVAYTTGLLKEALDNKVQPTEVLQLAKVALNQTKENLANMQKVAAIRNDPKLAAYAEGYIKAAMDYGYSQDTATQMVINLIDREKQAAGEEGGDGGAMFKQPVSPQGGPDTDDSGAGATPPGGPAGIDPAMLQQLLQNPQILQQLLAMMSGGQGAGPGAGPGGPGMGPGGPGAGGPPPMPPGQGPGQV